MEFRLEVPASPRQYEEWVAIMNRVTADELTVEEIEHVFTSEPESAWLLAYDEDGTAVATGVGRRSSIAASLYAMVRVLPEHRRRGAGTALHKALSEHACGCGLQKLWGRIFEDDTESRTFAAHRGFEEVGREYEVVLDVEQTDLSGEPPPGIELVSLAERPDLVEAVYRLDGEVGADVPSHDQAFQQMSYARWHELYFEGPGALPETFIAALAGDEIVGSTGLRRRGSASPIAENLLTAVRRTWRRRGIATALKREQIRRAREAGIEQIHTTNDETNVGMRGVNARLGYRPAPVRILVSGPLAT